MTHTLHLTGIDEDAVSEVQRIRAVREAMRLFNESANATDADKAIEETRRAGYSFLGRSDDLNLLVQIAGGLELNGIEAAIDMIDTTDPDGRTPEEVFADEAPGDPEQEGDEAEQPNFSSEAYETAMALLTMTKGDPLQAAVHAHTLGRTTSDDDLYIEAINAYIKVCPWIAGTLQEAGLITIDKA